MGALFLAFLAGLLSILSPCVLPIVPLVLGTALSESRYGLAALAAGLALSFTAIGLFVATIGFAIGLDGSAFRAFGALLMIAIGLVLMVPKLQLQLASAGAPLATWSEKRFGTRLGKGGLGGQFGVGLLLGMVWSPCVGPTLGAASVLAARGENLGVVALTMLLFGLGAALPLLILGMLSRTRMLALRGRLLSAGSGLKLGLGLLLAAIGLMVLTGYDKQLETAILSVAPDWLVNLTTRY